MNLMKSSRKNKEIQLFIKKLSELEAQPSEDRGGHQVTEGGILILAIIF